MQGYSFNQLYKGNKTCIWGVRNFLCLISPFGYTFFKCIHELSNVAFSDLLDLIKEAFPIAQIPESFYKVKKVINDLGLHYEKIHACPNDCMLLLNDTAKLDKCSVC